MAFNWRNSGWLYDALFLLLHAAYAYGRACAGAAIVVFSYYIRPVWLFADRHWDGWTLCFTKAKNCSREPGDLAIFGFSLGVVCFWFGLIHFVCRLKMRRREDAASYHPGLTASDRKTLEECIQQVPRFRLTATDYSECVFCLKEFVIGDEVRGLPCAHNFHVDCIDPWLRLKFRCPRCRTSFLSGPKPQPTVNSSSSASPQ